jgi:hypothetical protein
VVGEAFVERPATSCTSICRLSMTGSRGTTDSDRKSRNDLQSGGTPTRYSIPARLAG